MDLDSKGCFWA